VVQLNLESLFDAGRAAFDIKDHAIRIPANDREAIFSGKFFYRPVIIFGRAETGGKFCRRKEPVEVWAVWVVKLLNELIQFIFISEWESDRQRDLVGCGHFSDTRQFGYDEGPMPSQNPAVRVCSKTGQNRAPNQDGDEYKASPFFKSLSEKWELACGGAFDWALRWPVPYSPRWGCAERSALRTAKIPRRHPFPIFQTESNKPRTVHFLPLSAMSIPGIPFLPLYRLWREHDRKLRISAQALEAAPTF
jgi:hypothetical protein